MRRHGQDTESRACICGHTQRRIIHPERGRHSLQWFQSAVYCPSTSGQLSHPSEGIDNLQPSTKTTAPICEFVDAAHCCNGLQSFDTRSACVWSFGRRTARSISIVVIYLQAASTQGASSLHHMFLRQYFLCGRRGAAERARRWRVRRQQFSNVTGGAVWLQL